MVLTKAAANIKTGSNMVISSVHDVNHIMANTFYDINTTLCAPLSMNTGTMLSATQWTVCPTYHAY